MSRIVRLSLKARCSTAGLSIIAAFMVAMSSIFLWHIRDDTFILAMFGPALVVTIGANLPGAVGGLLIGLRWRRIGELVLDGDTVTVRNPGRPEQSFTRQNFRGYLPHRNQILTDDGTNVTLPASVPWKGFHESEMAEPWIKAWWPGVDLPKAIRRAEAARGWIDKFPTTLKYSLLAVFILNGLYASSNGASSISFTAFGLLFAAAIYVPELIEHLLNRRVIIPRELLEELSNADSTISNTPECTREPRRDDRAEV